MLIKIGAIPRGYPKATLFTFGFDIETLASLVRNGLATMHRETVRTGGRKKVARMRITDAGRKALEDR